MRDDRQIDGSRIGGIKAVQAGQNREHRRGHADHIGRRLELSRFDGAAIVLRTRLSGQAVGTLHGAAEEPCRFQSTMLRHWQPYGQQQ